jgi:hypothetical protein
MKAGAVDKEREADIIRRVPTEGLSPAAKSHSITRQRVHQIVRAYTKRTGEYVRVGPVWPPVNDVPAG